MNVISARTKKNQKKKQFSQLNETSKAFTIGNGTNVSAMENETSEQQTNGPYNDFERFVDSAVRNQVIENDIADKIRRAVDNAVLVVKNRMHDAIWQR